MWRLIVREKKTKTEGFLEDVGLMNYLKEEREGTWQKDTELNVHCAFSIRRIIA